MLLSRTSILAMFIVALVGPHAAFGQFSAAFTLTGDAQDPADVFPLTPLAITVTDTQTYGTNYWNNDISRLQLNWSNSSAGLNLATGATWTWGAPVLGLVAPPPHITINDTDLSDGLVNIQNSAGITIAPASPFTVGVLSFAAPAYNPVESNTHMLNLTGGSYDNETLTAVIDVMPVQGGDPSGVLLAPPNGTGLTLSTYTFTVVPGGKWTGGTDTAWQTPGNWSSTMVPGPTFTAVFDGLPTTNQPALTGSEGVKGLVFKTANWTISGSGLTLTVGAGGISSSGTGTNTVNPTVNFTGPAAIDVAPENTLVLAAIDVGANALAKSGAGTLVLAGAGVCDGGTTVSEGTLLVNKGALNNNMNTLPSRQQRVVPFSVERQRGQPKSGQLLLADLDRGIIALRVQRGLDDQTASRRGAGDQVHNRLVAHQRAASPVLRDEREQAVLDLVPLTRAGREVAHLEPQPQVIGQRLERNLPEPAPGTVAAAAVGRDQQLAGAGEPATAHLLPPPSDAVGRELGGVVVNAHADPSLIVQEVVHAVGDGLTQVLVQEVVNANVLGPALRPPLGAGILEIPHQFLLFGVHRDGRLITILELTNPGVDVLELGVAVGMRRAFPRLAIGLQTVAGLVQERRHAVGTDGVMLAIQFLGQMPQALARPAQGRFRVAAGRRLNQPFQRGLKTGVRLLERPTSAAGPTDPVRLRRPLPCRLAEFVQAGRDRRARQAGRPRDDRHAAPTQVAGLRGRPLPPQTFVHHHVQRPKLSSDASESPCRVHAPIIGVWTPNATVNRSSYC